MILDKQLRACSSTQIIATRPRPLRHGRWPCRAHLRSRTPVATQAVAATEKLTGTKQDFSNANFPVDPEGHTYHLGTKRGEVANRILSVGSSERAKMIARLLDPTHTFEKMSSRGFLTITGRFKGIPVSIVSTQMGMPNMDFVIRENRAVVDGQMAVVRFGTCGALRPPASLGAAIVAAQGSICIRRDPDAFGVAGRPPYTLSLPVAADEELSQLVAAEAGRLMGHHNVVCGLNVTADSFYSSQGRMGAHFEDHNEGVMAELLAQQPTALSLEMETFHLLDLARCSHGSIRATAFCIALAERYSNSFLPAARTQELEQLGGAAALSALTLIPLHHDVSLHPHLNGTVPHVWDYC